MHLKSRRLKAAALTLAALSACAVARAAYEDVGVGARVTGLGNAFTAVADDVYSIHYNPAGLATLARPELGTSYSKLLSGLSDNSNLQNSFIAYAHPLSEGRRGTFGVAWNYFTLDTLYRESSLYLSYGRELFSQSRPKSFYGGASVKYLSRSLGGVGAANQPIGPTGIVQPGSDPVLQGGSRNNLDLDFGFLYRPQPRWTVGMMVQHFLEPNIAFSSSDTDPLGRNLRLGGSYKTPFSTLSGDLDFVKAPDGSTDKQLALGAEKWLPTLLHGTFGLRSSLAIGSRNYRQIAFGVSYRIYKLQFDYGLMVPLGGLTGVIGTHRLGLTFRFGAAGAEQPSYAEAILENFYDLAPVATPEFRYQIENLAAFKRTAIAEMMMQMKADISAGRFSAALEKANQAVGLKPGDPGLEAGRDRLELAARIYPEIKDFATDPAEAALYEGILNFLSSKDTEALRKISYAKTLKPSEQKLEELMQEIERRFGARRPQVERPQPVKSPNAAPAVAEAVSPVAGMISLMEVAVRGREYARIIKMANDVLALESNNAQAYKYLGLAYYAQERHQEALKALRLAYQYENEPETKRQLRSMMDALAATLEKKAPAAKAAKGPATPQDIERLYEAGVEFYAQGRLAEAAASFQSILDREPNNLSARRALDRVKGDMKTGERR